MSKLVNGRIPAHTECPFRAQCGFAWPDENNEIRCHHRGVDHEVDFSCAFARGWAMVAKYEKVDNKVD